MSGEYILVVDDEEDILDLVGYNLRKSGYRVDCVASGEEALAKARADSPALIILDLMLPGIDGLEVCRMVRGDTRTSHIPIIMLTAMSEDADEVAGLELGADDYVPKPFSPRVLLARVRAILRRKASERAQEGKVIKVHDLVINPAKHEVLVEGRAIEATKSEFQFLMFIAGRPGWVFNRDQIIDAIYGFDHAVTPRSVDVMVAGLRKKMGGKGALIETVRGVGYRLKE